MWGNNNKLYVSNPHPRAPGQAMELTGPYSNSTVPLDVLEALDCHLDVIMMLHLGLRGDNSRTLLVTGMTIVELNIADDTGALATIGPGK